MKFQAIGKNIELTDAIKDHLDKKIFLNTGKNTDLRISLCVKKHRHVVGVTIKTNGVTLHAGDESEDLYASMDNVLKNRAP